MANGERVERQAARSNGAHGDVFKGVVDCCLGEAHVKTAAPKSGLSFKQEHRLKALPDVIAKLEAEIAKLEGLMADPALFTADPDKFQKASDALVARHDMLSDAEAEWMELEELGAG